MKNNCPVASGIQVPVEKLRQRPTQLVDGYIPPGQACPFKDNCPDKGCNKQTVNQIKFSCGSARAFDLFGSSKKD